jgi:hypothetical protein
MTSRELKKCFAQFADDAKFQLWNQGQLQGVRFVYACEFGVIWKFTPQAWWQFVTKAILNQGRHDLCLSRALRHRPRHILKGPDNNFYSSDDRMRCVNPLDWTVENWAKELARA